MKNKIIYLFIILTLFVIIITFLFIPRTIQHAIVIKCGDTHTTVLINGKEKQLKIALHNCNRFTVINFKYNFFKIYKVHIVPSISDRVMVKSEKYYDLESCGKIPLARTTTFYRIDTHNNISVCTDKSLIVGKHNIKIFKDNKNKLKTFFIFPMDYSTMRIGISTTNFSSLTHNRITIFCASNTKLYNIQDKFSRDLSKNSYITLTNTNGDIKVLADDEIYTFKHRLYIKGQHLYLQNIQRGNPSFTPSYNGILEITPIDKNLNIINETSLEDYLCKVIPSEMPSSGGIESLKCQAVAARTYAISDMLGNRFADLGFYVDDSTKSQVYNNYEPTELSNESVYSTKGLIMTYKNIPIDAKYYSTSCGIGTSYKDIWFNSDSSSESRPYLTYNSFLLDNKAIPKTEKEWLAFYKNTHSKSLDAISPNFRWNVVFTKAQLTKCLTKSLKLIFKNHKEYVTIKGAFTLFNLFPKLGNLQDIKILKRSPGGNVLEISFIFDKAKINVKKDSNIRSALRCDYSFAGDDIMLVRHKGKPVKNTNFLLSSFFSVEKNKDTFTIYGGGYGHGVGMSQYGAMEMSREGNDYISILKKFYKNINIRSIY